MHLALHQICMFNKQTSTAVICCEILKNTFRKCVCYSRLEYTSPLSYLHFAFVFVNSLLFKVRQGSKYLTVDVNAVVCSFICPLVAWI
jgi:hypothetical protein